MASSAASTTNVFSDDAFTWNMGESGAPEGLGDEWGSDEFGNEAAELVLPSDVPDQLYYHFVHELAVTEDDEIIQETCRLLAMQHIKAPWQIAAAPELLIQKALPWETHSRHLVLVTHARQESQRSKDKDTATSETLKLMEGYLRSQHEDRNDRKRARGEVVEEDQNVFKCWECLHR